MRSRSDAPPCSVELARRPLTAHRVASSVLVAGLALLATSSANGQVVEDTEPNRGGTMRLEARDPAVALERLHPADGYRVELYASERDFPIGNPVALAFDSRGRLWVSTLPSYPQRLPDQPPNDKIVILEDRDRNGKADHHVVWADGLHLPLGFELGDGGAYVSQQPDLVFLEDTDGDDRADRAETVLHGFGTEDSHHSISAFTWDPGGALYFQEGTFHHSQVETPYGPVRLVDAGVFRYEPLRFYLEVFVSYPFANPWGHVFDRWGQSFIADASGGANYFGTAISGNAIYPQKRRPMKVFTSIVRPTSGVEIVSSRHFPAEAQGNFLVNNTIGFQGIKQHRMLEEGSGFGSEEVEPLLYSTDINFRPVDLEFGPDGALYVVDWFNPLIGHMQYSLRDPRRDHGHGRIWRITYPSRPLLEPIDLTEKSLRELVELLDAVEDRIRYRVRRELRERDRDDVLRQVRSWLERLESDSSLPIEDREHRRLEALWAHQSLHVVEPDLLRQMLESPEPRARAAATRVLRFWRREVDEPLALLQQQVHDDHPRVRLEALLGLSYMTSLASASIALEALEHDTDDYLDYVLRETIDTLRPWWQEPLASGELYTSLPEPSTLYLLDRLETSELAELPSHPLLHRALLRRADLDPGALRRSLDELAAARGTTAREEIAEALRDSGRQPFPDPDLIELYSGVLRELDQEVADGADDGSATGRPGRQQDPLVRLDVLEDSPEPSLRRVTALARLLRGEAIGATGGPSVRATIDELDALRSAPAAIRARNEARVLDLAAGSGPQGREPRPEVAKIRIEWPERRRSLSLAEVRIWSGDENVAPQATVRQSSTAYRGEVGRVHDGVLEGDRESVTITTVEDRPWLELGLEPPRVVDRVEIWRAEPSSGALPLRVLWLDRDGETVHQSDDLLWLGRRATIEPERDLERAAIRALGALASPGALDRLIELTSDPDLGGEAIATLGQRGLGSFPEPAGEALTRLVGAVVRHLEATPIDLLTTERTRLAFDLGEELASRLPRDASDRLRRQLMNLGPSRLVLRAVPHEMVYDRRTLTVRAGKPVQLVFENPDVAPHNVVITEPGALAEIGRAADRMAEEDPIDAEIRDYLPETEKILVSSPLVPPGERFELVFLAPEEPGRYPYLCTFPGHWILMNGILEVVAELELSPAGSDAAPDTDRALTAALTAETPRRRYVRDWTVADLESDVLRLGSLESGSGDSHARGAALFREVGCDKCHRKADSGGEIGPSLDEIGTVYSPLELLRHVLEPSLLVDERYQSWLLETEEGELLTGLLVTGPDSADPSADPDLIEIRANPLAPDQVTTVPRVRIRSLERSSLSTMPTGLLTTLTRDEVLDLLRYLATPTP